MDWSWFLYNLADGVFYWQTGKHSEGIILRIEVQGFCIEWISLFHPIEQLR